MAAALREPERQRDLLVENTTPERLQALLLHHDASAPHPLTEEQRAAVRMVMSGRLSILTGGAGVGKTTCLRAVNAIARRFGYDVHQIALAGRAAQRMSDATGDSARTIASWLAEASCGRLATGGRSLVVVDEASMLDLPTMYRLLWHLHEDARLLLVGDVSQLPPIGYGLVLHRLVQSRVIPKVELTRVLRAVESTGIPIVSRAIRDGVVPPLLPYRDGHPGCSFIPCAPREIVGAVERIRADLEGEDVQVIAATYAGPAGIDTVNTCFHRFNAHGKPRLGRFAESDPVIWLKNDYGRGLWNGSMGTVVVLGREHLSVRLDGQSLDLAREDLGNLDLAYAISCHKAQGSQWGTVVVPIVRSRLMDRALLYTALTRAQMRVVLVGDRALLEETIRQPPPSLSRDVALSL